MQINFFDTLGSVSWLEIVAKAGFLDHAAHRENFVNSAILAYWAAAIQGRIIVMQVGAVAALEMATGRCVRSNRTKERARQTRA